MSEPTRSERPPGYELFLAPLAVVLDPNKYECVQFALRTLDACSIEKRREQITETKEFHCPLLITALCGYGGVWAEYAGALEGKIADALEAAIAL